MMTTQRKLQDERQTPKPIGAMRRAQGARSLFVLMLSVLLLLGSAASVSAQATTTTPTPSSTPTPRSTPTATATATATTTVTATVSITVTVTASTTATAASTATATAKGEKVRPTRVPTATPDAAAPAAATAAAIKRNESATATPASTPTPGATPTLARPSLREKIIYLTFDDGPSEYTQQILDILAEYDARATFFVLGVQAAADPAMIEKIYEAGHGVANHTWKHVNLTTIGWNYFEAEIADTADAVGKYESPCLRPPYGARTQTTYDYAQEMGYTIALWSIDTNDWRLPGANAIANQVIDQLHNHAVVLMHDGGGNRTQTVEGLRILLPRLQALGYQMRAVCRDDVMPQVGDHIVGIPSEMHIDAGAPEALAEETTAGEVASAAKPDANAPSATTNDLTNNESSLDEAMPESAVQAAQIEESEYAPPTPTVSARENGITFPADGEVVRGRVLVQGVVSTAGAHWTLEAMKEGEEPVLVDSGEGPTPGVGSLTIWDTRLLENGPRRLLLEISHSDGSIEQQIVVVTIRN